MDKDDKKTVQIGIKVPRWLRRRLKWLALRRETSVAEMTRKYWEKLVAANGLDEEWEGDE